MATNANTEALGDDPVDIDGNVVAILSSAEEWWRDRQPWLQERGYALRPRCRPNWVPSWRGAVLDVPEDGDTKLLAMPFLRRYNNPQIATVGEAAEFFRQIFEGLQFMHEHRIAHRDCMSENIMMGPKPLYTKMFHPVLQTYNRDRTGRAKHYTWTKRPVKYYLIDFGISRRYTEGEDLSREPLILGADRSIPEFVKYRKTERDPFPTDVYYLGNLIQKEFSEVIIT
ncbi:hypothetical protein OBBRIDRAFT_808715 [Obba rivulosa]|uniref:Protein kinase domain-containing protein n=1 Tax=Obba rivulosa TaxID=1052685 RepID=A0A8E2DEE6_9APHY|nr:hypothetical protein OBBRIDRAFT_808715 [Obba rivulosa]